MKFRSKLTLSFWIVGIFPIVLIGMFALKKADDALIQAAFSNLTAIRETKRAQLEDYFAERKKDMNALVETVETLYSEEINTLKITRGNRKVALEIYLHLISNQVITFSENKMVVDAFRNFKRDYKNFLRENSLSRKKIIGLRKELRSFYWGVMRLLAFFSMEWNWNLELDSYGRQQKKKKI